jgi:hypothetical protein
MEGAVKAKEQRDAKEDVRKVAMEAKTLAERAVYELGHLQEEIENLKDEVRGGMDQLRTVVAELQRQLANKP